MPAFLELLSYLTVTILLPLLKVKRTVYNKLNTNFSTSAVRIDPSFLLDY